MRKLKNEELGRLTADDFRASDKTPIIVVLDNVRSLNNIGSVFRSADAFLVEAIYLCGITAQPPHREIQKTALGATETVAWQYFTNTLEACSQLKANGYQILCLEQAENSQLLQDYRIAANGKYALVFGNEVKGVEQDVINAADACVEIPQFGSKHSFNIAVSAGIVLWEFYRNLKIK